MRRPEWWPAALWPGEADGRRDADAVPGGLPAPRSPDAGKEPAGTFLDALVALYGAEAATLYRLERPDRTWTAERWAPDGAGEGARGPFPAAGHPLTWCLREELQLQVSVGDLFDTRASGWALVGPVQGSDRVLVVTFRAGPPSGARGGLGAALGHLEALDAAGLL